MQLLILIAVVSLCFVASGTLFYEGFPIAGTGFLIAGIFFTTFFFTGFWGRVGIKVSALARGARTFAVRFGKSLRTGALAFKNWLKQAWTRLSNKVSAFYRITKPVVIMAGKGIKNVVARFFAFLKRKSGEAYTKAEPKVRAGAQAAGAAISHKPWLYVAIFFFLCAFGFSLAYVFGTKEMPFYRNGWFQAFFFCLMLGTASLITHNDKWGEVENWLSNGKNLLLLWTGFSILCAILSFKYDWSTGWKVFWTISAILSIICLLITHFNGWKKTGELTGKGIRSTWKLSTHSWKSVSVTVGILIIMIGFCVAYLNRDAGAWYMTMGMGIATIPLWVRLFTIK